MSALIGKSVLVDEPEDIPKSLEEFADRKGLRERDRAMLARINFRGKQPEEPEDWAFIWHAITRSIPDKPKRPRS